MSRLRTSSGFSTTEDAQADGNDKQAAVQRAKQIAVAEQYLLETVPSLSADLRHEVALDAIYSTAPYREVDTPFASALLENVYDFEWPELARDFEQFHTRSRGHLDWYNVTFLGPASISELAIPCDTDLRFWLDNVVPLNRLQGWLKQAYPQCTHRAKDTAVRLLSSRPVLPEIKTAHATWVSAQASALRLARFLEAESTSRTHLKQLCNQVRARLNAFEVLQQCDVQRRVFQESLIAEMNEPRGELEDSVEDLARDLLSAVEILGSLSRYDTVGVDAYPKLLHALAIAKTQVRSSQRWQEAIEVFNPVALVGRTCDLCASRSQYVSTRSITDAKEAPPYHPLCRCSLSGAVPEYLRGVDDGRYFSPISNLPNEKLFWQHARRYVRGLPVDFDLQWLRTRLRNDFERFEWPIRGVYE